MRHSVHAREEGRGRSLSDYWPLFSLAVVSGLAALATSAGFGALTAQNFMHVYMGIFLLIFALLKIFDLEGFKDGFAMYDLLATRHSAYGYVYPFVELGLGLAYLSFFAPVIVYILTIVIFTFGAIGVALTLRKGLDIACPCMGNILNVPLSTVTLTEDFFMVVMAAMLLAS